ncbi:hypothetical protein K461DRAFT_217845, partial [Myriangium duriaei CBS 260.36]
LRFFLRFLQLLLALVICGVYGLDIHNARKSGYRQDGRWVFALVTAGLSGLSCLVYVLPKLKSYWFWAWDLILSIMWVAVFGIFAKLYVRTHPTIHQVHARKMRNAVWVDLVNMLLWFVTFITGLVIWKKNRNA